MTAELYQKRPVVIEAMQLRWDNWGAMCDFVGVGKLTDGKAEGCYISEDGYPTSETTGVIGLSIPTLEGVMVARQEDWIIKGVKGEFYPVKNDIFLDTYVIVDEKKYIGGADPEGPLPDDFDNA